LELLQAAGDHGLAIDAGLDLAGDTSDRTPTARKLLPGKGVEVALEGLEALREFCEKGFGNCVTAEAFFETGERTNNFGRVKGGVGIRLMESGRTAP
jgi:hypothetical protein